MQEREQILYMQVRLMQTASERWKMPLDRVAGLFSRYGLAEMIEEDYELYHTEGDESVYADIMAVLECKGVDVYDRGK